MVQRITYGTLTIAVLLALFVVDVAVARQSERVAGPLGELLGRGSVLPITFVVMLLLGAVELNHLARLKGARPFTRFACLMVVILVLTPWLSAAGWLGHGPAQVEGLYWQVIWMIAAIIGVGVLAVIRREPEGALRDSGITLTIILLLGFLGSFGLQLRCSRDIAAQDGAWLLLIVLLATKASDIGAYFAGSAFGRHRLIPTISPSKSVEGTIGGLLASALVAVLIASAGPAATASNGELGAGAAEGIQAGLSTLLADVTRAFSSEPAHGAISPILRAFFLGLFLSAAGQFGDLVESCFKRDAGVKDSGKVIPHFGGILDLVDSPVFAMPVGWFLLTAVWNVA